MSNVIALNASTRLAPLDDRVSSLISCFGFHRRKGDDVFWMKENAELLNIMETSGVRPSRWVFEPLTGFYDTLEQKLEFFPQYYRFFLSMCLDLEDLGFEGNKSLRLAEWVIKKGMPQGELSDLQRLEARRLMARRGLDPFPNDPGLEDRIRAFTRASGFFAIPNKKAAYELTHAVFYLSEYGRKNPNLDKESIESLLNVGILAMLEQNNDLVAEVCIALRFCGETPPSYWENWLRRDRRGYVVDANAGWSGDDYQSYFMACWSAALTGEELFKDKYFEGTMAFLRTPPSCVPLRELSHILIELEDDRSIGWEKLQSKEEKVFEKTLWRS